jgi:hypothetical protein
VKKYELYAFLIPLFTLSIFLIVYNLFLDLYIAGLHPDYYTQHLTLVNYFRESFYETKTLFSQFSFQFGGISSSATLIYYGSMNPIMWLSILVPFCSIHVFFEILLILVISTISMLNYIFLKYHKIPENLNIFISIVFSVSPFIIGQLQTQMPFILFYPFMLLCLIALQNFKNRYVLLIISMSMVYYINFTFSVSVFVFLSLYLLYLHIEENTIKNFFSKYLIFLLTNIVSLAIGFLPFILQVLASNPRSIETVTYSILKSNGFEYLLTAQSIAFGYNWSLYIFGVFALLAFVFEKNRTLIIFTIAVVLATCIEPINRLLNMFLYYDVKVFINYVPIMMLMFSLLIVELINQTTLLKLFFIGVANVIILIIVYDKLLQNELDLNNQIYTYLLIQNIALIMLFFVKNFKINVLFLVLYVAVSMQLTSVFMHGQYYVAPSCDTNKVTEFYRVHPTDEIPTTDSMNVPLCQSDYLFTEYTSITNKNLSYYTQYNLGNSRGSWVIYDGVMLDPLTEYVLSIESNNESNYKPQPFIKGVEEEYIYSNNLGGFSNYDMVTHVENDNYNTVYKQDYYNDKVEVEDFNDVEYQTIGVSEVCLSNDYAEIEFSITGADDFTVNGVKYENELEKYSVLLNCPTQATVDISSSIPINIENVTIYGYIYDEIVEYQYPSVTPTKIDIEYNEKITFDLNMETAGMMVTTIPYDDGFNVKVDGVDVETEVVNHYFLGVPLESGNHTIEITFKMKGFYLGLLITFCGLLITLYLFIWQKR